MSLMMAISMMPTAFADVAYAESSIPEIDYGTPGEDYEPGQVIACVEGGENALIKTGVFTKKVDGAKVSIDDTLMEFNTSESNVDKAAAISECDEQALTEAINEETSQKEEYSFVLINSNKDDITSLIEKLKELDCVKFAEPNVICEPTSYGYSVDDATKEPAFDYQWYLDKNATNVDYDINAKEAYQNSNFSKEKEVVVAVMDTGVDYEHPDLKDSMWNQGKNITALECLGGGKYGINTACKCVENTEYYPYEVDMTDPMDDEVGHGTHCASTIAST